MAGLRTRRSIAPLALLALALAVPSAAGAATRCVPTAEAGCDSEHVSIAQAVTAAADGDTVRIAAGIYQESIESDKRLDFVGAGGGTLESAAGATVISPPTGTALSLSSGGSVRGIRAIGGAGIVGGDALEVTTTSAGSHGLTIVDFVGIGGNSSNPQGTGGRGLDAFSGNSTQQLLDIEIANSRFKAAGDADTYAMFLYGRGLTATLSRTRVEAAPRVLDADLLSGDALYASEGKATIEDSTIVGGVAAELLDGDYTIRRSRLIGAPGSRDPGLGLLAYDGSTFGPPLKLTVEDSLVVGESGDAAADAYALKAVAYNGNHPFTIDLRGSTFVARGADPDGAIGLLSAGGTPAASTIDLRNTVAQLEGPAEDGEAALVARHGAVVASSSAFGSIATAGTGTATIPGAGSNLAGDPQLGAGLAPLAGSPLIDRGDPAATYPGELDVDGGARSQDGNGDCAAVPDVGAFEIASPPCPASANVAPRISRLSLSRKRFTARKPRHKGRRLGARLSFTLSERARLRIVFEREVAGRRTKVRGRRRCVAPTARNAATPRCTRYVAAGTLSSSGRAGANAIRLTGKLGRRTLKPGAYRLTLTAIDAESLRSEPRRLAFTVLRP